MDIKVAGGAKLKGTVITSGSKNAAIPILCASLLAKGKVLLKNVPRISDIDNLIEIIKKLNCQVVFKGHTVLIDNTFLTYKPLLFDECKKIRGSYYLIGVFLTLFAKCEILMPGGCQIGNRPIDLHLKAFSDLGYDYHIENDVLSISKKQAMISKALRIEKKSVGASINALLGGLSLDEFEIENGLFEPEGIDLINFLNKLGFNITHSDNMLIYMRKERDFKLVKHTIIPDRIEAMTYAVMGLLCGDLTIKKVDTKALKYPLEILVSSGFKLKYTDNEIVVSNSYGKALNVKTDVYPLFPTDLQPLFGVLCVNTRGQSIVEETVFENRMHIYHDLINSGINCKVEKNTAIIEGGKNVISQDYKAYDLRHGAALLILALIGNKSSTISNFEYVFRGYDDIIKKIVALGADIQII